MPLHAVNDLASFFGLNAMVDSVPLIASIRLNIKVGIMVVATPFNA